VVEGGCHVVEGGCHVVEEEVVNAPCPPVQLSPCPPVQLSSCLEPPAPQPDLCLAVAATWERVAATWVAATWEEVVMVMVAVPDGCCLPSIRTRRTDRQTD
jgi:hypothetical protein